MNEHIESYDLLVVGGGINGAGIARDAAGRGLSVLLCEQGDLAGATSSASSKLVHGGLRYLEHYQFRLVAESLAERTTLLNMAPHIVKPMRFVLPHAPGMRPAWMVSMGLFLYDILSKRDTRLGACRKLDLTSGPQGKALQEHVHIGFEYADCTVDDSRLVVLNARAARDLGATILVRTALAEAHREDGCWRARLRDAQTGRDREVRARVLMNVAGPWVRNVIDSAHGVLVGKSVRLVKGSHIVVPCLYDGDHAYILQNDDGRVVFVIPYQGTFTLIGTTEDILGAPPPLDGQGFGVTDAETEYLCSAVSRYFTRQIAPADVAWSYAGVRPLFEDKAASASAVTREYVLDLQGGTGDAALLSVFGGKLTTYRRLAEKALETVRPFLPNMGSAWTSTVPLPGGDLSEGGMDGLLNALNVAYPWAQEGYLQALANRHGALTSEVLGDARDENALGENFGQGLYAREVDHFIAREWARTADDILWRRTKMGLVMAGTGRAALTAYLDRIFANAVRS